MSAPSLFYSREGTITVDKWLAKNGFAATRASALAREDICKMSDLFTFISDVRFNEELKLIFPPLIERIRLQQIVSKRPLMYLPVYWDIENVNITKGSLREFVCKLQTMLYDQEITAFEGAARCILVYARGDTCAADRHSGEIRTLGLECHEVTPADNAADMKIKQLIEQSLRQSTPDNIPAYMVISGDQNLTTNVFTSIRTEHRQAYGVFKPQSVRQSLLLETHATRVWHTDNVYRHAEQMKLQQQLDDGGASNHMSREPTLPSFPDLPSCQKEVVALLGGNYPLLLELCQVAAFALEHSEDIEHFWNLWHGNIATFADDDFMAFYIYRRLKENQNPCTFSNSIGACGVAGCIKSDCKFSHACMYCGESGHGWFESDKCTKLGLLFKEKCALYEVHQISDDSFENHIVPAYCGTLKDGEDVQPVLSSPGDCPTLSADGASAEGAGRVDGRASHAEYLAVARLDPSKMSDGSPRVGMPRSEDEVKALLANAPTITAFVRRIHCAMSSFPAAISALRKKFADGSMPLQMSEQTYLACYAGAENSKDRVSYCMKHNGPARRGCHSGGYGECDHKSRTGEECGFRHNCLMCDKLDHGWFDYRECGERQKLISEWEAIRANNEVLPRDPPFVGLAAVFAKKVMAIVQSPISPPSTPAAARHEESPAESHAAQQERARAARDEVSKFPPVLADYINTYASMSKKDVKRYRDFYRLLSHTDDFIVYYHRAFMKHGKLCINFNIGSPCKNSTECKSTLKHLCIFCDNDKGYHGWETCPKGVKQLDKAKIAAGVDNSTVERIVGQLRPSDV